MSRDPMDDFIDKAIEADPVEFDLDEFEGTAGPPLSDEEVEQAKASLARWQNPDAFKMAVDALCVRCTASDWFNQPRLKFLHDAFVLARFARQSRVDWVCLAEPTEQWPDGFVQRGSKTHNIEVTATHAGRKLGEEYRDIRGLVVKPDPIEDWITRAESIPRHLDEAVTRKSKKLYSSSCWLVVYLNIDEWGIRQKQTEQVIAQIKMKYAASFEALSVLWKGRLY